ncbi:MAG: hypothetical protein KIT58_00910 [Planctomycetota bacterium]|nr:hypothetical protein [Planctomycetota bacterium]
MTKRWATAMKEWARLGEWIVVQVRYLGDDDGTCELCGKTHLKQYWDVRLAAGGEVRSIGSKCGPYLTRMTEDWESRHDARGIGGEDFEEARREFNTETAGLRKRVRIALELGESTLVGKDRLFKGVLAGSVRDREVDLIGKKLALIERIEKLRYADKQKDLDYLRDPGAEEKHVRWLGLRTTSREKGKG